MLTVEADASAKRERLLGEGEAARIKIVADAEAERIKKTGEAEADATKAKVSAYGGPEFQLRSQVLTRFAEAIQQGNIPIVPSVNVVSGSDASGNGEGLMQSLMSLVLADRSCPGKRSRPAEEDGWQEIVCRSGCTDASLIFAIRRSCLGIEALAPKLGLFFLTDASPTKIVDLQCSRSMPTMAYNQIADVIGASNLALSFFGRIQHRQDQIRAADQSYLFNRRHRIDERFWMALRMAAVR